MTEARIISLLSRRISGPLDREEELELETWAKEDAANRDLLNRFSNDEWLEMEISEWRKHDPAEAYAKWVRYTAVRRRSKVYRLVGWVAAASVIGITMVVGLNHYGVVRPSQPIVTVVKNRPVLPGGNKAILTLGNGDTIVLDKVDRGDVARQGNVRLIKTDDASIAYRNDGSAAKEVSYNTVATPRAGQYQVILPDGSHVWLNNVSSLRYPVSFQGQERRVELTGEGYFEIAKDARRPFTVEVGDQEIVVLGTSFDVMAYSDERAAKTTLLSGLVRVSAGGQHVTLRPNEQAQWSDGGRLAVVNNVPADDIVSWKNGFFYFGRASLREVMNQIARWYDIDVVYQGAVPDVEFGGKIDRGLPLEELLKYLDKSHVHFRLDGRKLTVLPN